MTTVVSSASCASGLPPALGVQLGAERLSGCEGANGSHSQNDLVVQAARLHSVI